MMIKFLAHGTGKAGNAAAYVLASHDHNGDERPGVAVLRGDPQQLQVHVVRRYVPGTDQFVERR